jgi:hypothetical protein
MSKVAPTLATSNDIPNITYHNEDICCGRPSRYSVLYVRAKSNSQLTFTHSSIYRPWQNSYPTRPLKNPSCQMSIGG